MSRKRYDRVTERRYFDSLAQSEGEIWWGNATEAGKERLCRVARLAVHQISRFPAPKVLELGCGTGAFSEHLLAERPTLDLTAWDISPQSVQIAKRRCGSYQNARFLIQDITTYSGGANRYDAVVGKSILHHLPLELCLEKCRSVLNPGGIILFFEPNMLNPQIALEKNIRFIGRLLQNSETETAFFRWTLARTLAELGFERISVSPIDFLHPIIPRRFIKFFDSIGRSLESVPVLREFAGSLMISALKPASVSP